MRKSLIALLLLSSAVPALAAPDDRDRGPRAERHSAARADADSDRRRKGSSNEASRPDRERPRVDGGRRAARPVEPRPAPIVSRPAENRRDPIRAGRQVESRRDQVRTERQADSVRTWRERDRQRADRRSPVIRDDSRGRGTTVPITRRGDRRPNVDLSERNGADRWRNEWRRDRRYDWRSHRARNSSLFRIGFYYDPFGYNYRRLGYGYALGSPYYSSRYWLNDPFMYRLPPAWGPYRWVRYWDDAVLVDTRSGFVVDVIYDFFW